MGKIKSRDIIAVFFVILAVCLSVTSVVLPDSSQNPRSPVIENIALALLSMSATILGTEKTND